MRYFYVFVISILLTGCMSLQPTLPKNYNGPTATIRDTVKIYSKQKADMFYLTKLNDANIYDSSDATYEKNYGEGLSMTPEILTNKVVAGKQAKFTIIGKTIYAAPILELLNPVYKVSGDIVFTPQANHAYVVKGELSKERSVVWLEDETSNKIIQKKIIKEGK